METTIDLSQAEIWINKVQLALVNWTPKVIAALVIFIVGYILAKIASRLIARGMRTAKLDETLVRFLQDIVHVLLVAFVTIASLGKLGVDTTSLAAIFAAAGLAIGLALQGSLGNFASGVLLIANRPFKVGDFISIGGVSGTVEEISIFATKLNTPDNIQLIVPNGKVTADVISNFNGNSSRRLDMVFGISYKDDLNKARELFERVVKEHPKVLPTPAPQVWVRELSDSSVNFVVRPWAKSGDYWAVWADLTGTIKQECDRAGISIPFPQRDVHIHGDPQPQELQG